MNILYTKEDLIKFFKDLGIESGMILEVHVSLKKFGHIIGGAQTFVDALLEVLGYNGTLIMASQCSSNSEPSYFTSLDFDQYAKYRKNFPAFDIDGSDTYQMGVVLDNLRRRDKTIQSAHPNLGFVAIGKYAKLLCNHQRLDFGLDESSPLGRLYELKAHCLLAGVDYSNMTSLHLCEYKSDARPIVLNGSAINENGQRVWKKYLDVALDNKEFNEIGVILERRHLVNIKNLHDAKCKLLRVDMAVDQGIEYFNQKNRFYR